MDPVYRVRVEFFAARLIHGAVSFVEIPPGALITVVGKRQNPAFLNIRYRRDTLAIHSDDVEEHCDRVAAQAE